MIILIIIGIAIAYFCIALLFHHYVPGLSNPLFAAYWPFSIMSLVMMFICIGFLTLIAWVIGAYHPQRSHHDQL